MKLRHAAALALVGWYLMVPTIEGDHHVQLALPMSQWARLGTFKSAQECATNQASRVEIAANAAENEAGDAAYEAARNSVCVQSDDPRLREK